MNWKRGSLAQAPLLSIGVTLFLGSLVGLVIFTGSTAIILGSLYGMDLFRPGAFSSGDPQLILPLKLLQASYTIGSFLVPGLIGMYLITPREVSTNWTRIVPGLLALTVLIMLVLIPVSEGLGVWNQQLNLPDWLAGLQTWIEDQEQQVAGLLRQFLQMDSAGDLLLNLVVIALLPGLSEEVLFRGVLQPTLARRMNPHVAIWITAILFSAIHLQFLGFLPRLVLGAVFGYLAWWGKSLWYPIVGHFLNNGIAVIMVYVVGTDIIDQPMLEEQPALTGWFTVGASLMVLGLLLFFRRLAQSWTQKKEAQRPPFLSEQNTDS